VDGCIERRLSQKSSQKLAYVSIDNELRRQTSWSPPSQLGCSLVDVMQLENSFFRAEQANEPLLGKSASGDTVMDVSCATHESVPDVVQTELIGGSIDEVVLTNESDCIIADGGSRLVGLDSRPFSLEDKSLSLDTKPVGSDRRPLDLDSRSVGLNNKPFGLDSKPVGLDTLSTVKYNEPQSYDGTVL